MDIEQKVNTYIERNLDNFSKRVLRFLAMYFPNAKIRRKCWLKTNVILGEGTYLNPNITMSDNYLENETLVFIGKNCSIAPGVVFAPVSAHNNSKLLREADVLTKYEKHAAIHIGNDVWIGANCTIGPGITIGDCCIIGANSYVCKDIPAGSLAYGSPVKVVKQII